MEFFSSAHIVNRPINNLRFDHKIELRECTWFHTSPTVIAMDIPPAILYKIRRTIVGSTRLYSSFLP